MFPVDLPLNCESAAQPDPFGNPAYMALLWDELSTMEHLVIMVNRLVNMGALSSIILLIELL